MTAPYSRPALGDHERLTGLGATIVSDRRPEFGWVILADPEGNEFCVEISVGELESAQPATVAT